MPTNTLHIYIYIRDVYLGSRYPTWVHQHLVCTMACDAAPWAQSMPPQDLACHFEATPAMAETQLDSESIVVVEEDHTSLPILCDGEPAPKRLRLEIGPRDCSQDRIRWIPGEHGLIPFVRNGETKVVHSGTYQMEVFKLGSATVVQCLSGCPSEHNCASSCQCLCHLLKSYYIERECR